MGIPYQIGETIRLGAVITDYAEEPVNPLSVKVRINFPDGTEAIASSDMVNLKVGEYRYDYLIPSDLGTYCWNVTATGAGGRVTIVRDMFSVNVAIC